MVVEHVLKAHEVRIFVDCSVKVSFTFVLHLDWVKKNKKNHDNPVSNLYGLRKWLAYMFRKPVKFVFLPTVGKVSFTQALLTKA